MKLADLSYESWLEHAFGPAVAHGQQNPWYHDIDADFWNPEPDQAIGYFTRLFEEGASALLYFSDAQIAQGLTYLLSTSASGDNGWFSAKGVAVDKRLRCVGAIGAFFAQVLAPKCTAHLSHLSEPAGDLNRVCYMWWDEFPCIALPDDPARAALDEAALTTMRRILALDSMACQESALHGLGHWARPHPERVAAIVDEFLAAKPAIDPRLATYARAARCGCVL